VFLCKYDALYGVFWHMQVTGGQGYLGLSWLQIQCKYKSNQKKFVKSRIGDELKHFKLESTYLEQIHRRFSVLKIKSEVQLKISNCQKNLNLRFKNFTVLKPCITVLKPSKLKIPSWSKIQYLRNQISNLFCTSVRDNYEPCGVYV